MKMFDFFSTKSISFGYGALGKLGGIAKELRCKKALLVTDKFLVGNGAVSMVEKPLLEANIGVAIYDGATPSPTQSNAEECYDFLIKEECDFVIGLGGGSPMDVAKAAALLVNNPKPVSQYVGVELVPNPAIPIVAIPTTAGTGSESSNASILKNEVTHIKGGIMSHQICPTYAIVDLELTLTLPPRLTASTGLDALTHAIEGYVAKKASPITELYQAEAIRLIAQNLRIAVSNGQDRRARYNMSLAALLAGIGMATASCGAVHALAYPMEGKYRVAHGDANAALLAAVMKFNIVGNIDKFAEIAVFMGENVNGLSKREAAFKAADAVATLCKDINVPSLSQIGVMEEDLKDFADSALPLKRLMDNNPRTVTKADAMRLYKECF